MRVVFIFWIQILYQIYDLGTFYPSLCLSYDSLNSDFKEQSFKNLIKFILSMCFYRSYFGVVSKQSLPNPRQNVSLLFSYRSFIVLGITFWSQIKYVVYVIGDRDQSFFFFFCLWISSCSITIFFCKDYPFSTELLLHLR